MSRLFTDKHRFAIRAWRQSGGAITPSALHIPETGCVGTGNSVQTATPPNEGAWIAFGHVSRALYQLDASDRQLIETAYGDMGDAVTTNDLHPHLRWRAVAPYTPAAKEFAAEWAKHQAEVVGVAAVRWWQAMTSGKSKGPDAEARIGLVTQEAKAILRAAEERFAAAYDALGRQPFHYAR